MKNTNRTSLAKSILMALLLVVAFCTQSFSQNEKCLSFSRDMIKEIKGKIICEYIDAEDTTLYGMRVEVPQSSTLEDIESAIDNANKTDKVVSAWKINFDKNYEKKFNINGKRVLVTFYPSDKIIYFDFPRY